MSLAIDVDKITRVLLADGWHDVIEQSFNLDSYELLWGDQLLHAGGNSGICATGFEFRTTGRLVISGPLTSVLAVQREWGATTP